MSDTFPEKVKMKGEDFGEPVPRACDRSQNAAALMHPEKKHLADNLCWSAVWLTWKDLPKVNCRRKPKRATNQTIAPFCPQLLRMFLVLELLKEMRILSFSRKKPNKQNTKTKQKT